MSASIKVKVVKKPVVKLKVLPTFPSSVIVESPILLDRTGEHFNFSLDINSISSGLSAILPDLFAIEALTGSGMPKRVSDGVWNLQTGTNNYLPKWLSNGLTGTSLIFDDGTNVGVGTPTPGAGIDIVKATGRIGNGTDANFSLNGGSGAGKGSVLGITGQGVTHYIGNYGKIFGGSGPDLALLAGGSSPLLAFTNNLERFRIDGTTGFVGINKPGAAASYQLEVVGTFKASGASIIGDGTDSSLILNGGSGVNHGSVIGISGQGVTHFIGNASKILGASSPALTDYVAGANDRIFFNNGNESMRMAGATNFIGIGTNTPTWLVDVRQASSVIPWTTLATLWNTNRTVVGNYPLAAQYGSNLYGTVEVLVGAVDVPATTNASLLNAWGIAGYARTASSQTAAVGMFGYSGATANGAFGSFGGNTIATNSPSSHSGALTGFDILSMYGFEIDVNMYKLAGGGAPSTPLRGLYVIGGSEVQTLNIANGVEIDAHGVFSSPKIPWKKGVTFIDGAATVAIDINATGVGSSVSSQPIQLSGRDAGGILRTASIYASLNGDIIFNPPATGQNLFQSAGTNIALVDGLGLRAISTTQSTSTSSGALTSAGGLGVAKDVFIGGNLNVSGSLNMPTFSATKGGTNQTGIPAATPTKVTFTTEVYDVGSTYDAPNSKWVPPAGRIEMTATAVATTGITAASQIAFQVWKNGAVFKSGPSNLAISAGFGSSMVYVEDIANGTDYYEIYIFLTGTAPLTLDGGVTSCYFQGKSC